VAPQKTRSVAAARYSYRRLKPKSIGIAGGRTPCSMAKSNRETLYLLNTLGDTMNQRVPDAVRLRLILALSLFVILVFPSVTHAPSPNQTILYFIRHMESQPKMISTGPGAWVGECNRTRTCCTVVLNPTGRARQSALSDWFEKNHLVATLTKLIATNKQRTVETLAAVSAASKLTIEQYPSNASECDPDFETARDSMPYVIAAIKALPTGSRALIANHGDTLYEVIQETTGLDISDDILFPKEPGTQRVLGNNQLWIVQIDATGKGKLIDHIEFELKLEGSTPAYFRR
jgi:hypothetical protein